MKTASELLQQLRNKAFLARLHQLTGGDTSNRVNAGDVGQQLGMPLEATLATVAELHEEGLLHRCGKLDPPHGPQVHLTGFGAIQAREAAEWASPSEKVGAH